MNRLLELGFIKVGYWRLEDGLLKYLLESHNQTSDVLYRFVFNGIVMYIGKTTGQLARRMHGYQKPMDSQRTNTRVNREMKRLLKPNKTVDILILAENGMLRYGTQKLSIALSLAAGLETNLIREMNPKWNMSGNNGDKKENGSTAKPLGTKEVTKPRSERIETVITVVLGKAYFTQGFFNVKKRYSDQFGDNKERIRVQLGENPEDAIEAYVNREANQNGTPRIMCGSEYTRWIKKEEFKQGDTLIVDILSPNSIRLRKR